MESGFAFMYLAAVAAAAGGGGMPLFT